MGRVIHLTTREFCKRIVDVSLPRSEWRYLGDKPALVDFFASWCGPCRALSPVLDRLADEYDGKAYICKVDVDAESALASVFNVRSVPTLLFVRRGAQPEIVTGLQSTDSLHRLIDRMLEPVATEV